MTNSVTVNCIQCGFYVGPLWILKNLKTHTYTINRQHQHSLPPTHPFPLTYQRHSGSTKEMCVSSFWDRWSGKHQAQQKRHPPVWRSVPSLLQSSCRSFTNHWSPPASNAQQSSLRNLPSQDSQKWYFSLLWVRKGQVCVTDSLARLVSAVQTLPYTHLFKACHDDAYGQGRLNLMLGPGAERFCRPSIPLIYRVSFKKKKRSNI